MISKMSQLSQLSRAVIKLSKNHVANLEVNSRSFTSIHSYGLKESICLTNTTILPDSSEFSYKQAEPEDEGDKLKPIDEKLSLRILRKNLSTGPGLKVPKNRDNLVLDFFNLSKSVMENRLSVEEFIASYTFTKLQEQMEFNIDIMGNSQIVNLLASVIKMRINPSTSLVKLLEHEVKFRLKSFNLNQIIKMLKFYNSTEMTSDQSQLVELLSYRVRAYVQNDATTVKDLNNVLHLISTQQASSTLLSLVEEKLLSIMTLNRVDDDDLVSRYISSTVPFDCDSLCDLFVKLAENKRRPTPLLKIASSELCKLLESQESPQDLKVETITLTLNALVSVSYPHRPLITKLFESLTQVIDLDELDSYAKCNLLRTIRNLRWRPDGLLEKFFDNISTNQKLGGVNVDHHVISVLLQVAALVNYDYNSNLGEFYKNRVEGEVENQLNKGSRQWLSYVWALAALNIAKPHHIKSVLDKEFYQKLDLMPSSLKLSYSDVMKLLNLKALAQYEYKFDDIDCGHLDELTQQENRRSGNFEKLSLKMREVLNGMVKSENEIRYQVRTPYGFTIDSELLLNENLEPSPIESTSSLSNDLDLNQLVLQGSSVRCALIYTLYEDTIANTQGEVVGHNKLIARILKSKGYTTIFLTEMLINKEKTSSELSNRIKALISENVNFSK